jgi:hypothetical protein
VPVGTDENVENESAFLREVAGGHGVGRLCQRMVRIDCRGVDDGLRFGRAAEVLRLAGIGLWPRPLPLTGCYGEARVSRPPHEH